MSFSTGNVEPPAVVEADEPAVPAHADAAPAASSNGDVRTLAKPPVRKLAKDLGVDLAALVGSGDGGVVTREDVRGCVRLRRWFRDGRSARLPRTSRAANASGASRSRASAR